jgi:hypothetical protein
VELAEDEDEPITGEANDDDGKMIGGIGEFEMGLNDSEMKVGPSKNAN